MPRRPRLFAVGRDPARHHWSSDLDLLGGRGPWWTDENQMRSRRMPSAPASLEAGLVGPRLGAPLHGCRDGLPLGERPEVVVVQHRV